MQWAGSASAFWAPKIDSTNWRLDRPRTHARNGAHGGYVQLWMRTYASSLCDRTCTARRRRSNNRSGPMRPFRPHNLACADIQITSRHVVIPLAYWSNARFVPWIVRVNQSSGRPSQGTVSPYPLYLLYHFYALYVRWALNPFIPPMLYPP